MIRTTILLIAALYVFAQSPARAEVQVWDSWVYGRVEIYLPNSIYNIYNDPYDVTGNPIGCVSFDTYYRTLPDRFRFTLDGNNLSLNCCSMWSVGGSSTTGCYLYLSGLWAVCGSVANGVYTADPYATFIYGKPTGGDDSVKGYIQWAADTPVGYSANLLLGYAFAGDAASTYTQQPYGNPVTGTFLVRKYSPYMGGNYPDSWTAKNHVFSVTYVPEPTTILTLITGLAGIGCGILRKRK